MGFQPTIEGEILLKGFVIWKTKVRYMVVNLNINTGKEVVVYDYFTARGNMLTLNNVDSLVTSINETIISVNEMFNNESFKPNVKIRDNYNYSILEKINTTCKIELRQLEQKWIDTLPNVNKVNAYLNEEQKKNYKKIWYENNKEKILNKSKDYYEINQDKIKAYQLEYKKKIRTIK